MTEADLYGPLWKGANQFGWHLYRIVDGPVGLKPADIAGITDRGIGVLIEVKLIKVRPTTQSILFPAWSAYRLHQIAWLKIHTEANALSLAIEHDLAKHTTTAYVLTDIRHYSTLPPPTVRMRKVGYNYTGWQEILDAWASKKRR